MFFRHEFAHVVNVGLWSLTGMRLGKELYVQYNLWFSKTT
jgi:hypothetical protein